MHDTDSARLPGLVALWDNVRKNPRAAKDDRYDREALDCAARLAAAPPGVPATVWALGLVLMAPYLTYRPGEGVVPRVTEALRAADVSLREGPCPHPSHPYEEHDAADDRALAGRAVPLADPELEWLDDRPREEWLCPLNAAGFARIALDIVEPGSVPDVPPRLPLEAVDTMADVSALLHGYPKPWTDVNDEITWQAFGLSTAAPEDRAGHLLTVRAVTWYAVSGMVRKKSVLDDLVEALERTLPFFADATCAHDFHAELPRSGPEAAELGIMLSSRGGRGLYERRHRAGRTAALETVVCPAFMAETAAGSLKLLREKREQLFGERDTTGLDAVYLRPDGRLDVATIAERLVPESRNEEYANDLGLWAARRLGRAEGRERAVLLLAAGQALKNAYSDPPLPVARDVLAVLRDVTAAPLPPVCGHEGGHPSVADAAFVPGLPHFYAPEEFPAGGEPLRVEVWTCPAFAAAAAAEFLADLEGLDEDD